MFFPHYLNLKQFSTAYIETGVLQLTTTIVRKRGEKLILILVLNFIQAEI